VFEVDPAGVREPQPITSMGQFYHEAAAVDPVSGAVYMTEDSSPHGGLYRYLPDTPGKLLGGGRLQMMRVEGWPELTDEVPLFTPLTADWVDIVEPTQGHTPGTHDEKGVVSQGMQSGGTGFRSLEGCVIRGRELYFTSKNGGRDRNGLVFHFHLERAVLEAIYEASPGDRFGGPDNLVFSPRGALLICEDRLRGDKSGQYLAGLTAAGELLAFCQIRSDLDAQYAGHALGATARTSEWAGACFSPDGNWMFANIFNPGVTCAITGPWADGFV